MGGEWDKIPCDSALAGSGDKGKCPELWLWTRSGQADQRQGTVSHTGNVPGDVTCPERTDVPDWRWQSVRI